MYTPQDHSTWRNLARHEESFNDMLYQQIRKTPWWLISAAVHGVLVAVLFTLSFSPGQSGAASLLNGKLDDSPIPELNKEILPVIEKVVPREQKERPLDDPVVKDVKESDHSETDNDHETEEMLGEKDMVSNAPFSGPSTNPAIGVGGGAGGAMGNRGGHRNLTAVGMSDRTENSVNWGLEWLKNHQSPEGLWDCDGFSRQCVLNTCGGPGNAMYDPGVTGLALLAFLGAGETHNHGHYRDTVKRGLKYLKQIQDPEGCFGPRTTKQFVYNHACAALAMTEAYAMTSSPLFKSSAQAAIDFIHKARNPYLAWRYGVRPQENDTSVSGWMLMALKSAKETDLRVDESCFTGMKCWLDKVTEPEYGRVGYTTRGSGPARQPDMMEKFPADRSESLTAVGILCRIFIGEDPAKSELIRKGTDLCLKDLPVWNPGTGEIDMYYWYYGSLALFQVGGDAWNTWNTALKSAVIEHQRQDGDEKGSWDPIGPWGHEGGRIYSTALCVMCMEVYYRYKQVFGARK